MDDMVLYVQNPTQHLAALLREHIKFEGFSSLGINWAKSIRIPLTQNTVPYALDCPLKWSTDPVEYLEVWIHKDHEIVIRENYGRALGKLDSQVARWIKMHLSLADRVAVMKMIVVPRFLYLFSNIPIILPSPSLECYVHS